MLDLVIVQLQRVGSDLMVSWSWARPTLHQRHAFHVPDEVLEQGFSCDGHSDEDCSALASHNC